MALANTTKCLGKYMQLKIQCDKKKEEEKKSRRDYEDTRHDLVSFLFVTSFF